MQPLPIDPLLPDIVASLAQTPRLVLEAPPGAGKTTRVPPALLDSVSGEIVVLEPRRLAARMAAKRVADEMQQSLGETVGYQVRFEDVSSAKTRIRFVTEGVLTRKLLGDPDLRGVGAVLLDEFHERHLQGDVALALLHRLTRLRPELRIVVMSATLATSPIAAFLRAPTLRTEGKRFDVAIEHLQNADDRPLASQVASAVRRLVNEGLDGDVLVFLPGAAEIRKAAESCAPIAETNDLIVVPLHGDLPPAEQDRAVRRAEKRKVILSTNVAESSVTIDGVVAVIDAGLARVASHAAWSGLPRLDVQRVSRASAIQRAGRAGRTRPGRCLRLYTNADFESRAEHETPEIRRVDLAQTELELRAAGTTDLAWLEAPPEDSLAAATQLLQRLGAIDDAGATAIGREMARLGVHPRQARILVEAKKRGVAAAACTIAALLGERDIRLAAKTRFDDRRAQHGATERSDLVAMLDAFNEAARARFSASAMRAIGLDVGATMAVERARAHLRRIVRDEEEWDDENALLTSVLAGYPDRVARRLRPGARALALAGGRTAELAESSVVRDAPWMVAVDAEERGRGVAVRVASAIEPEWLIDLFPERIVESRDVAWSSAAERVDAVERMTYDGLAIDESPSNAASEEVSRALAEAAIAKGVRTFAPGLDAWLARARFAASIDSSIAAPTDDDVRAALVEACEGRKSFA